jgi:two-component system LytT family sensor kinase
LKNRLFTNPYLPAALHLSVWVGGLGVFVLVALNGLNVEMSILRALVNILALAALFYINAGLLVNKVLEKGHYFLYFALALVTFFAFSEFRTWLNSYFELQIEPSPYDNILLVRLFSYTTSGVIIIVSTLYQVLQNRYFNQKRDLEMLSRYQAAQLQFLKAQINPHFLFNTLNNIYALAVLKSEDTPKMILKLSELLRYAIYEGKEKTVLLERECLHIQKLTELFQMRAEAPLNIELELEGAWTGISIEPMILLPLVENCFKHTDFEENIDAFAKISLKRADSRLCFTTINSKRMESGPKDKTGGVGLENIKQRLELSFEEDYQLEVKDEGKTFSVKLSIPLNLPT